MRMAVCDVCRILDGDHSLKMCEWCGICQSWICAADLPNLKRRAQAMMRKKLGLSGIAATRG